MLTAILISCIVLAVISIVRAVGNHIICGDDNIYEILCALAWIGWYVTVIVYLVMLVNSVNNGDVSIQWKPQHLS